MIGWASEELDAIDGADELEIASLAPDGAVRRPTRTWVARVDDDVDDRIDDADRTKYSRIAANNAGSVLTPQARAATLELMPRPTPSE